MDNKMNIRDRIRDMFLVAIAKQVAQKLDKNFFKEDKFMDKKEWYKSKTIWAGIITILITIYNTISPLLASYFGITLPEIPSWVYSVLGALGIYGRVMADKKIG